MKFSPSNVDFGSLSPNPISSKTPAHASVKKGYPSITGYFTDINSSNVKTVADRHRHAAYHNRHCMVTSFLAVLTSMTLKDLEPPK